MAQDRLRFFAIEQTCTPSFYHSSLCRHPANHGPTRRDYSGRLADSRALMYILWNQIDHPQWDEAHVALGGALQQDWAYGTSLKALGIECHRASVIGDCETVALAQFICRRYVGLIGFALCTRGPLWLKPVPPEQRARIYRELKRTLPMRRPRFALFSPDLNDPADASVRGLVRVMTGYSTVMVDLTQSPEQLRAAMEGRWRNRLVAAEKASLNIVRTGANPAQYRWLLEEEQAQRASKGFYGLPLSFVESYIHARAQTTKTMLVLRAEHKKDRVAAMLFLIHGSAATYHVGWSNDTGRDTNAHNLLLWRAFAELRERGVRTLDLGGINTRSLAGISRFKIGSGGQVITYAGTFV